MAWEAPPAKLSLTSDGSRFNRVSYVTVGATVTRLAPMQAPDIIWPTCPGPGMAPPPYHLVAWLLGGSSSRAQFRFRGGTCFWFLRVILLLGRNGRERAPSLNGRRCDERRGGKGLRDSAGVMRGGQRPKPYLDCIEGLLHAAVVILHQNPALPAAGLLPDLAVSLSLLLHSWLVPLVSAAEASRGGQRLSRAASKGRGVVWCFQEPKAPLLPTRTSAAGPIYTERGCGSIKGKWESSWYNGG